MIDLGAFAMTFWRGRWIILACLAVAVPLGLVLAQSIEPYYRTRSLLFISPGDQRINIQIGLGQIPAAGSPAEEVGNEIRVLTSQSVFERVIQRLELLQSPVLNPALGMDRIGNALSLPWLGSGKDLPMPEEIQARAVLTNLREAVTVEQEGLSQIIAIDVTLNDAVLAAEIADAIAQSYIDIKQGEMQASLRQTAEWLSSQVVEMEAQAQASAAAAESFRISEGLIDVTQLDALSAQLTRLNEDIAAAVQTREAAVLRQSAEEMSARLSELTLANTKLERLEQQAAADRFVYERLLEQARQTYALQSLQKVDARILENAAIPLSVAGPNTELILLLAAFVGGAVGTAIVYMKELLHRTIRSREELTNLAGVPVVACLPIVRRRLRLAQFLAQLVDHPRSEYGESLRGFRNLVLPPPAAESRVIAFTSSIPGEGKSLLSVSLALMTGVVGRKAVILDCDQWLSQLANQLDLSCEIGLSDVLSGKVGVLDAVQVDQRFGLHVVPALRGSELGADMLATPRLSEAIATLRGNYDLIILDSPPMIPVSDVGVIARECDDIYFICQWRRTSRGQVKDALSRLRLLGTEVSGIVFSQVDLKREATFRNVRYRRYREYWNG